MVCEENEIASQLPMSGLRPPLQPPPPTSHLVARSVVYSINTSSLTSLQPCSDLEEG
jgi:hypothetical protein